MNQLAQNLNDLDLLYIKERQNKIIINDDTEYSLNKNNLAPKKLNRNKKIISHDFKSPRRIPSIPDKDTKFGFGEDKEGKMAILTDPNLDQKFDGTQSNSIGPDRYNTLIKKHNNALDWKKAGKKDEFLWIRIYRNRRFLCYR